MDTEKLPEPNYFGDCPECGCNDGYFNIGRGHWFFCYQHKTAWFVGWNLMSSWRHESEEVWKKNTALLSLYREVEPWHRWGEEREKKGISSIEYVAVLHQTHPARRGDGGIPL